jgi:cytochrome c oxidase cbb3-type subunit III
MSSRCPEIAAALALLTLAVLSGCHREERRFSEQLPGSSPLESIVQSDIRPGGTPPPHQPEFIYQSNAYAISQGKQLYEWFNCTGCHAMGGGAIGPALMDDQWIYGDSPQNIYATIVQGRPNGMPSFGGKIPAQQVWQLVAYVRSLAGEVRKDADTSRSDHLFTRKSEQSMGPTDPRASSPPPQPPK